MTKSLTTEPTLTDENVAPASRKREITAVAAATTVTIVFGIVANMIAGRLAAQVADRINPKPKTEIESTN